MALIECPADKTMVPIADGRAQCPRCKRILSLSASDVRKSRVRVALDKADLAIKEKLAKRARAERNDVA